MSKRKSLEDIRVEFLKGSGGNHTRHLSVSLPTDLISSPNMSQSTRKSLLVLAPKISKNNSGATSTQMTTKVITKVIEKNYPKTKFSAGDKSQDPPSYSPRLKVFPAEKIKKVDGNTLLQQPMVPQINYYEANCTPSAEKNTGYGDVLAASQQIQISPRHQSKNSSVSQQNVPHTYRIENPNQSEAVLPSQKIEAPGGQPHRPFVAFFSNGVSIREIEPKKQVSPKPIVSHTPPVDITNSSQEQNDLKTQEKESLEQQNGQQESPQADSEIPLTDYVKQPVGGRVAALHQKRLLKQKQDSQKQMLESQQHPMHHQVQEEQIQSQHTKQPIQQYIPQEQIQQQLLHNQNVHPYSHNLVSVCLNAAPTNECMRQQMQARPQEVYQKLHKNATYQHQMQQEAVAHQEQMMMNQMQQRAHYDYCNQHQQNNRTLTNPGMTSPQDRFINRERNLHMNHMQIPTVNQRQYRNAIPSDPSLRAEINPYVIDLVTPHQTQLQSHVQTPLWQQSVPDNQYTIHNNQNNFQTSHSFPIPTQNSLKNNSNGHQMRSIPQKQIEEVAAQQEESEGKPIYHFTPQMIRDQEQLIATMQQQRIPEQVMQRQFLLLLNEQQKHLSYLELLAQGEGTSDKPHTQFVQKKVTKIQTDEKPEWMAHLTPPRVSYNDLENVKNHSLHHNMQSSQQQKHDCVHEDHQNNQEAVEKKHVDHRHIAHPHHFAHQQEIAHQQQLAHQQQVAHQQQIAYQQQVAHQNYQLQLQQQHIQHQQQQQQQHARHQQCQTCQHQVMEGQRRSDQPMTLPNFYHPYDRMGLHPFPPLNDSPNHLQHQFLQCSYPHHHQQLHPQFQEKHFQNFQQSGATANNREADFKMIAHQSEAKHKKIEPFSLLKLRLLKEVVQPQKRNNGLQDPETVQEALEALKHSETKKGLEYVATLNEKRTVVRLNGAQEPGLVPEDLVQNPPHSIQEIPKKVSANGLENKRNPNNPLPPSKIKHQEYRNFEFPRVKNSYQLQNYTHIAERENGSVAPTLHHQHPQDYVYQQTFPQNLSVMKYFGNHQQPQQSYNNRQAENNAQGDAVVHELKEISGNEYVNQPGGDQPNEPGSKQYGGLVMGQPIQESKMIGGVTYHARKPSYIPKIQLSAESYSGNNHTLKNTVS